MASVLSCSGFKISGEPKGLVRAVPYCLCLAFHKARRVVIVQRDSKRLQGGQTDRIIDGTKCAPDFSP